MSRTGGDRIKRLETLSHRADAIPRTFADIIVTEYGVARLLGKSIRERARELISIAHPDFRRDLEKAAQRLYYP